MPDKQWEISIRPAIKEIENVFSKLNTKFFRNHLQKPVIVLTGAGQKNEPVWITNRKAWKNTNQQRVHGDYHEMCVNAEYLNQSNEKIISAILHAIVHLYNTQNNIEDTSRGGMYHNKAFKEAAEKHGLVVVQSKKYGWADTELSADSKQYVRTIEVEIPLFRPSAYIKSTQTVRKYYCTVCRCSVRATKEVRITCTDCGVEYKQQCKEY